MCMEVRVQVSGMDTLLAGEGSGAHTEVMRLVWQALLPSEPSQGPESYQFPR